MQTIMKTTAVKAIAGAVLATLLISCTKNGLQPQTGESENTYSISFNAVGDMSKTTINDRQVLWNTSGETVRIDCFGYDSASSATISVGNSNKKGSNPVITDSNTKASFNITGIAQITAMADAFDYIIGYPYDAISSASNRASGSTCNYTIPSDQTPGDDFDDKACVMVASVLGRATQGGDLGNVTFSHAVAYASMTITNLNCGTETVQSVKFTASGKDVAGKHKYNYLTGAITNNESTVKDAVTVTVSPTSTSSFAVSFNLAPITFSANDKFKVVINTDAHTYTREITLNSSQASALRFVQGTKTNFTVNFNGIAADAAGDVYEKYTTSGTTIPEGDYIIYAGGVAMKNVISSNRFSYETVTVTNNKITTSDASIVWHISGTAGSYLLYNASVNKYAAGTGVKNQGGLVGLSTDTKAVWTITNGTDGAVIVNNYNSGSSVNANLRRNNTYGFATYGTTTGTKPVLYKKQVTE